MNKLYIATLTLLVCGLGASAQTKSHQTLTTAPSLDPSTTVGRAPQGPRTELWSNDFSDINDWTLASDGPFTLNWQIGVGLVNTGSYPTTPVLSPTADNGYAMIDSDGGNNSSGTLESSTMTIGPIDLSGYPNVVLEFQTFYRKWTNEECYVVISTNNTDWPALTPTSTDGGPIPNVYEAFPAMEVQAVIPNPTRVRINISDAAGNEPQVWVRFHWAGEWGYSWFVDDVSIIEQPAYELIMDNGFLSHTGTGEEYGRIPTAQLNADMNVGGDFFNFGIEDMTNVGVAMEVLDENNAVAFSANSSPVALTTGTTSSMNEIVAIPALSPGLYRASFTASSAENANDDDLTNNVYLRNFMVSEGYYSLDGIGNHPLGYQATGSMGSNSFTDNPDGMVLLNYYPIREELTVHGLEILLNGTTRTGGFVIASVHDTATVLADDVTTQLASSQPTDVTEADTIAGVMRVYYEEPVVLPPGGYYVGLTLFSNDGAGHIRVVDDLTVPQPTTTSVIYLPAGDDIGTFTNGNAYAIRMLLGPNVSVQENSDLLGVSLYPNPTNGLLNINTTVFDGYTVEVVDMIGKTVLANRANGNSTIDLRGQSKGVYAVRISSAHGSTVERVTLD